MRKVLCPAFDKKAVREREATFSNILRLEEKLAGCDGSHSMS